jgi:hypothetical protein
MTSDAKPLNVKWLAIIMMMALKALLAYRRTALLTRGRLDNAPTTNSPIESDSG